MTRVFQFPNRAPLGVYVFDVSIEMAQPIRARAGEVLVVRPGTDEPMMVVRRGTAEVVREGPSDCGALLVLLDQGVILERRPSDARRALAAGAR